MNKIKPFLLPVLAGVLAGALLMLLASRFLFPSQPQRRAGEYEIEGPAGVTNELLTDIAFETAGYIKSGDYEALSELVHPDFGLVLSPFATVNLTSNLSFSVREVAAFGTGTAKYTWGVQSDGGAPITMTVSEYFQRYVYDRDYISAPLVAINYAVRVGNSLENVTDVFPGAQFVDLCFPGDASSDYSNWSTLRLVFEEYNSTLRLTAIIHSESTI